MKNPPDTLEKERLPILDFEHGLENPPDRFLFDSLRSPQLPVAEISPLEAGQCFTGLLQNFLNAICQPEHPVVRFISSLMQQGMFREVKPILAVLETDGRYTPFCEQIHQFARNYNDGFHRRTEREAGLL